MVVDSIKENNQIAKEYKELLKISYQSLSKDDRKLIRLAFNTSCFFFTSKITFVIIVIRTTFNI